MRNALLGISAVTARMITDDGVPGEVGTYHVPPGGSWFEGGVTAPLTLIEERGESALLSLVVAMKARIAEIRAALPQASIRQDGAVKIATIILSDGSTFKAYSNYGNRSGWSRFGLAMEWAESLLPEDNQVGPTYL